MRINRLWASVFTLVISSTHAGPDGITNYLMNDSVSLMDWGISRMEQRLETSGWMSTTVPEDRPITYVEFDWDANRIVIVVEAFRLEKKEGHMNPPALCRTLVESARRTMGINLKTGLPFNKKHSWAALGFSHRSFERKAAPKDLLQQVDKLIDIKATVHYEDDKRSECKGGLLGTEIFTKVQ